MFDEDDDYAAWFADLSDYAEERNQLVADYEAWRDPFDRGLTIEAAFAEEFGDEAASEQEPVEDGPDDVDVERRGRF